MQQSADYVLSSFLILDNLGCRSTNSKFCLSTPATSVPLKNFPSLHTLFGGTQMWRSGGVDRGAFFIFEDFWCGGLDFKFCLSAPVTSTLLKTFCTSDLPTSFDGLQVWSSEDTEVQKCPALQIT